MRCYFSVSYVIEYYASYEQQNGKILPVYNQV